MGFEKLFICIWLAIVTTAMLAIYIAIIVLTGWIGVVVSCSILLLTTIFYHKSNF